MKSILIQRRRLLQSVAFAVAATGAVSSALAQGYPNRSIKFIVPYSAGGLPDTVARIYAQRLGERLGQPVVVDNKPGANGVVAAQAMASSPKDGYTFLVTDGSMFSINPALYKTISYDYKRDFVPVSLAARAPLYLAVHPKIPANNLRELIALAKSKPGMLTYGSSGIGSTHHLSMEAFKASLSLDITHIPFKGTGQSVPALIGGQVDMLFSALPSLSGFVKAGQVRLIGNNAGKRSSQEPNVPTLAEVIPGFDFAPIVGVLASTGTPQAAIDRISAEMTAVAKQPETIQILSNAGIEAIGGSASEYGRAIVDENERLGKAVYSAGIKQQE
ncbi:tripartite tricarboxylate transporter substrate binding protein [Limnohabitans sp.]|jgi:tripartite-type tricarboxylate transporter receptor subunit TctC|uniref:Bug family tripartite tricarboxylate transporter substrate binding protein n=1 Tax=Limnohabitans sp. TaxID=1907725 RepID=UPI00286F15D2|nr:tripartite tricarboxylate transporter substrate binding protein [Limnohabitans sp.]